MSLFSIILRALGQTSLLGTFAVDDESSTSGVYFCSQHLPCQQVEELHDHIAESGVWSRHSRLFELCTSEALCIFAHCAALARLFSLLCGAMLEADEVH